MSDCLSVCLSLKISITTKPIGLNSSGNIPTGPVVVLGCFLGGWDTPNLPKKKNTPFFLRRYLFFPNFFLVSSHKTTGGSTSSTSIFF